MTYLAVEAARRRSLKDWAWVPLRRLTCLRREANLERSETLLALSADSGVRARPDDGGRQLASATTEATYWVVHPNDLVFNPMWALEGGVAVSALRGAVSPAYRVYELSDALEPRFMHYYVRSRLALEQYRALVRGVTTFDRSVTREDLADMPVPVPSRTVQRAITDYLDTETARIDGLIAKKEALDALLRSRERSSIEQQLLAAATGTAPLRRLVRTMPQYGAAESGEEGNPEWPRYIRITDLRSDGSLRDDDGIKRLDPRIAEPFLLEDNDLLFARSGATAGKAFRYRSTMGQACFAGYLIRFQVDRSRVRPELIELWTQTGHYWGQIAESTVQATIQNVSADKYMSLEVPTVPEDAQDNLVETLRQERSRIALARRSLRRQVELLGEHRRALITAAVTGELEIPGVA